MKFSNHALKKIQSYARETLEKGWEHMCLIWAEAPLHKINGVFIVFQSEAPALSEELLKLQHKVRVLERSLRNEQTLSQEMHSALCQREQEYRNLGECGEGFCISQQPLPPSPPSHPPLLSPLFLFPPTPPPPPLLSIFSLRSEADYQRVLVMADKAKELTDVQDELQMMTAALEKSKKHTQR